MNPVYDMSGNQLAAGDVVVWDDFNYVAVITAVLPSGELRADIQEPVSYVYAGPEWLDGTIHRPEAVTRLESGPAEAVIHEWRSTK